MEVDIPNMLRSIESGENELLRSALESLCNLILFNQDDRLYLRLRPEKFVSAMLALLHKEHVADDVLELNARALRYLFELEPATIGLTSAEDYRAMCNHIERADLATYFGKELAEGTVKVGANQSTRPRSNGLVKVFKYLGMSYELHNGFMSL